MTTRLVIKNFSCIKDADIELANLTIIIGPQASGKSLISKLVYFFHEIILRQYQYIAETDDINAFKTELGKKFKNLFPTSGWGGKRFSIEFKAEPFEAKIERLSTKSEKLSITLSEFFVNEYNSLLESLNGAIEKERKKSKGELDPGKRFQIFWGIQNEAEKEFAQKLGKNSIDYQVFIPAGRSFFTSLGKLSAVFEHNKAIDPITISFGRLFVGLSDKRHNLIGNKGVGNSSFQKEFKRKLLGGEIEHQRNGEIILAAEDGRKIPLAYTSSGQQELYPLFLVLEYIGGRKQFIRKSKPFLFIEEPEAHLFPSAQAMIIEYIASFAVDKKSPNKTLITTHSPYILAQLNNLLKAGKLAKANSTAEDKIGKIIRKESWLPPESTVAYAIVDSKAVSIVDEDGLIDGSYIDSVSADISEQFERLLNIEYPDAKA